MSVWWLGLLLGCAPDGARSTLSVLAASSLTDVLEDLEPSFEAAHPGVDLRLTFAGSQVLRLQIEQGAEADVFVSADPRHLRALEDQGEVVTPRVVARNELAVIVPLDGDAIARFDELADATRIVVGTPQGPVGAYTRQLLERARDHLGHGFVMAVERSVVSEEPNVRLVRAKVEMGEADAAIVYRSDVSPRVREVGIPDALQVRAQYAAGIVARSAAPDLAVAFLDYLEGAEGHAIFAQHGFVVDDE